MIFTKTIGWALCFAGGGLVFHVDTLVAGIGLIVAGLAIGLSPGQRA
jgi:hypothetical protein